MRKRFVSVFAIVLALTPVAFLFNNCGGSFSGGHEKQISQAAILPSFVLLQRPDELINVRDAAVSFTAHSNGISQIISISCALNDENPVECADTFEVANLTDGDHVITLRAQDDLGNISEPFQIRFRVDTTAPVITVNSGPAAVSGSTSASIAFTVVDGLSGVAAVECSFNEGNFAPCENPQSFANLMQADYSLKIRARDLAGNQSLEVVHSWRVDITAPMIAIDLGPASIVASRMAEFAFSGIDEGVPVTDFECSVDNGAFAPCESPKGYANVQDGNHSFSVRGRDSAGNLSEAVTHAWMVDLTLPTVAFTLTPVTVTSSTSAIFEFAAADLNGSGVARTECSLNGVAFATCTSPVSLQNIPVGPNNFRVQAIDNAGNISSAATHDWLVTASP